jgi:hypothetical protein
MAQLKINEAIAYAAIHGKRVTKKELAAKLWAGSSEKAQAVNMSNLCSGKTTKVDVNWIEIIAGECKCTADYLLGIESVVRKRD